MMKRKSLHRRTVLASLVVAAFAGPALGSGCGGGFHPISEVEGLRVLAVEADKPYAQPGDKVTFTLTYTNPPGVAAPQIRWLGPCINPIGDTYYGCYPQFAGLQIGQGKPFTFSIVLPAQGANAILPPGHTQGTAFVFFAVCDGTVAPLDAGAGGAGAMSGLAGSFPIACLDANGQPLSAAAFVPGYTQVYAFADGRTNQNPDVKGILVNQVTTDAGVPDGGGVQACNVPEATRLGPASCGKTDPFTQCSDEHAEYQITVDVPPDVAELDPASKAADGTVLHEVVWVDYFADRGDIDTPTVLISDATTGMQPSFSTRWIAPPASDAGALPVNIWAVVHDNRGGETVRVRQMNLHVP